MEVLLIVSFIAGMLTILAPCSLTLLPVILGGSVQNSNKWRPYIIIASLALSILIFAFALQLLSSSFTISFSTRRYISGGILVILGIFTLFPGIWDTITTKLKISQKSEQALSDAGSKKDLFGAIATGAALGPVFTTCSPTFGYVLSIIVGQQGNTGFGLLNIILYIIGLSVVMLMVTIFGQWFITKIKWAANPKGNFRKFLGILFILVGISVMFQFDKRIEAFIVQSEMFGQFNVSNLDQNLLDTVLRNNE